MYRLRLFHLAIVFIFLGKISLFAQSQVDSIVVNNLDTTVVDSGSANADVDTMIYYNARTFEYVIEQNALVLLGDAEVKYKSFTIKAEKISVKRDSSILVAEGIPDPADSSDTPRYIGLPVLEDKGQEMKGFKVIYNFQTERGQIVSGDTKFENGFYHGEKINRVDEVFYVQEGWFTSCDSIENPHFYFQGEKMKIYPKNKVITRPVVLYIADIPLLGLPFGVFPNQSGRRSGFIMPSYGRDSREGRYLRGGGYYFAPSDYWDTRFMVDFFDKTGFIFRNRTSYKKRYSFNGNISSSATLKNVSVNDSTTRAERRWDLRINHNQDIDPTLSIRVDGTYISNKSYYKDISLDQNKRLNQNLRSNATINKRWEDSKNSMTINMNRNQNLNTGDIDMTLPRINFTRSQEKLIDLFRRNKEDVKPNNNKKDEEIKTPWYESITYSYNSKLENQVVQKGENSTSSNFSKKEGAYSQHNFRFNAPQNFFGVLNITPNLSYTADITDRFQEKSLSLVDSSEVTEEIKELSLRQTFNTGVSVNTKIYGLVQPKIGKLTGIRHVISPSLSFNYKPDFSESRFGYYETYIDTSGNEQSYDRFGNTLAGATPRGKQKSLGINVNNQFQAKYLSGEEEKKINLFTIGFNTNYNFAAKQRKLADLRSSFRIKLAKLSEITMSTSHSFYQKDSTGKNIIDKYLFEKDPLRFARLENFSLNFRPNFSFGGKTGSESSDKKDEEGDGAESENDESSTSLPNQVEQSKPEDQNTKELGPDYLKVFKSSWSLNLGTNFSLTKQSSIAELKKTFWTNLKFDVNLTPTWKITYTSRYDWVERDIVSQQFTFYRDLHCWEMKLNWTPSGPAANWFFQINVKASELQDLKFPRRSGAAAGRF